MRQRVPQNPCGFMLSVVEMPHIRQWRHDARMRVQSIVILELPSKLFFQHFAGVIDETLQAVASQLIEGHKN